MLGVNDRSHLLKTLRPVQTFDEVATWWEQNKMPFHKPSSRKFKPLHRHGAPEAKLRPAAHRSSRCESSPGMDFGAPQERRVGTDNHTQHVESSQARSGKRNMSVDWTMTLPGPRSKGAALFHPRGDGQDNRRSGRPIQISIRLAICGGYKISVK